MPHGLGPVEPGAFQLENLLLVCSSRWYQRTLFLWGPLLTGCWKLSSVYIQSIGIQSSNFDNEQGEIFK